jgi:hypothetical protein
MNGFFKQGGRLVCQFHYGGGGDGGARRAEKKRQKRIDLGVQSINEKFGGFDDGFYNQRALDYEGFAVPQQVQQYDRTKKNLTYSLARSGLLNSSVQAEKSGALERENAQQLRNIADTGRTQSNQLRQDVEQQRSNLVSQVQASADPGSASAQALRTSLAFQQPTSFAPIGDFFETWTRNYLANKRAQEYDPQTAPLFSWGSNTSERIVK